jgi:hypothetical protein
MVERWNIGFQKDNSHFNFIVNPAGGGTINPTLHYPLRAVGFTLRGVVQYSPTGRSRAGGQNPLLHYSIVPSFQL